jgi:chromosomal replication initiation ATPase DnaA
LVEELRNKLMDKPMRVDRENPRYERAAMRPSVDQVLKTLAKRYRLKVEDLMKGRRGKDNEHRRSACLRPKSCAILKLKEIAEHFGTRTYGTVG